VDLLTQSFIKINVRGGILSPGLLKDILEAAKTFKIKSVYLGERQNIFLRTFIGRDELLRYRRSVENIDFEINSHLHPNILSSYVAEEIFTDVNNWLSEGGYKDVLDSFDYKPKLKINLVDNTQGLVPLFTGNLNFISSQQPNFWYLYVQHPTLEGIQRWPELIYSGDIATVSKALETELSINKTLGVDLEQLRKILSSQLKINTIALKEELILPRLRFPNYEGMNKTGQTYWLGIYRRNFDFPVDFLEQAAQLCISTKIGALYLTPFKSLIIKGIKEEDRIKWERLLGKYGINIRHNISELNWKTPDLDDGALRLKNYLARELDDLDVRTYGLTFAIKTKPMEAAASVLIEKGYEINLFGKLKLFPHYNIYYVPDFNPNKQEFKLYVSKRPRFLLSEDLLYLCQKYYNGLTKEQDSGTQVEKREVESKPLKEKNIFACSECYTLYDEELGDPTQNIDLGTTFASLPNTWHCPVCEAPKESFKPKKADKTLVLA
jgi:rubredoxin